MYDFAMPLATSFLGKFRLRTIFIVPFVVQIAVIVGLVAYLAFSAGKMAVEDLTARLRNEITSRVQEKLRGFLAIPHVLNQNNAAAVNLNLLRPAETDLVKQYFQQELMHQKALTLIGFGTEQPIYVDVARLDDNDFLKLAVWNPAQGSVKNWKIDLAGKIAAPIATDPSYDHRKRPWYMAAVAAGQPGWSKVYVTETPQRLVVSATQPVYSDQNNRDQKKLFGVAVSSISLSGLSDFLACLNVGKTGQTFVIEPSGELVATSTREAPFMLRGAQPMRLNARDSADALTRATSQFISKRLGDLGRVGAVQDLDFSLNGARQFVQVAPFRDDKGLAWLIVVVIPEADFMREIDANTRTTIFLSLGALVFAIGIGFLTTRWVTGPILAINQAASQIIKGDWDKTVRVDRTDELGDLASMFNRMSRQLKEVFTTLEQRVDERTVQLADANSTLEARVEKRTAELAQAMEHLMQTEKMATLGGMVAGITHELNTPLSNVRLAAAGLAAQVQELADGMVAGKITRSALDRFIVYSQSTTALIDRASARSASLIESFKQVAVDQSSERRCSFDLRQIVDDTAKTLGPTLKTTPFTMVIDIAPGIVLDSYPGPLEQIITNLVTNSVAHAFPDRDSGVMTISARQQGPDLEIIYCDDGIGMTDDIRLRIFNPFFTTKAGQGGSGLGMYTVYNLVTGLFGGSIVIDGRPGVGARFTLGLPNVFPQQAYAADSGNQL
jgi:signal transduction histidine kinase